MLSMKDRFCRRFPRIALMLSLTKPQWTVPPPSIETDPLKPEHREITKYLREQHLPGVDTDDEEGVKLEIEMGRTIMLGAGSALAFSISKALDSTGPIDGRFWWASYLLLASVLLAWAALYLGTHVRRKRVERKYTIYFDELNERIAARDHHRPVNEPIYLLRRDAASNLENIPRYWNDFLRGLSAILAGLGLVLLLMDVQGATRSRGSARAGDSGRFRVLSTAPEGD